MADYTVSKSGITLGGTAKYEMSYVKGASCGLYDIEISGLTSDIYEIVFVPGTLTVTPKELTLSDLTITAANKTYDGSSKATVTATVNDTALVAGDIVHVLAEGTFASADASSTAKSVSYTVTGLSGTHNANYKLTGTLTGTTTATISQAPVTVSVPAKTTYVYDGEDKSVNIIAYANGIYFDSFKVTYTKDSQSTTPNAVGTYAVGVEITDTNYVLSGTVSAEIIIKEAQQDFFTIEGIADTVTYGDEPFTLQADGVETGAQVLYAVKSGTAATVTEDGKVTITGVGSVTVEATSELSNHITKTATRTFTVKPKTLNVTATPVNATKVYDGTKTVDVNLTLDGVVDEDKVEANYTSAAAVSADVENNKTVFVNGITLLGDDESLYQLSSSSAQTSINVTKKPITAIEITATDKVYDGDTKAEYAVTALAGVVDGEEDFVTVVGNASFADEKAGADKVVTLTGYALSGSKSGNYELNVTGDVTAKADIEKATVDFTLGTLEYTYDGNKKTVPVTATVDGVAYTDYTVAYQQSGSAAETVNAGDYDVVIALGDTTNYETDFAGATLKIVKASQSALTITGLIGTIDYGATFALSAVGGNGAGSVTWTSSNKDIATVDEAGVVTIVGTGNAVTITATKAADGNYQDAQTATVTFTPAKKSVGFKVTNLNQTYDGKEKNVTVTPSVGSNNFTITYTDENGKAVTKPTNAGIYYVDVNGKDNYDGYATAVLTIKNATVDTSAYTFSASDAVYGKAPVVTQTGTLPTGVTAVVTYTGSGIYSETTAQPKNAGSYVAILTISGDDYDTVELTDTFEITKAALTATPKSVSRAYGAQNPVFEIEYTGFAYGEDKSVIMIAPTATTAATINDTVGEYDIIASGGYDENYTFTFAKGTLTIGTASGGNFYIYGGQSNPYVGNKFTLTAYYNNEKPTVTWSSDDTDVATVSANGEVEVKSNGTATITATMNDSRFAEGLTATFTLTAAYMPETQEPIYFDELIVEKQVGGAAFTNAALGMSDGATVKYTSSNTDVATVNEQTGEVTIKAAGTTVIKATATKFNCADVYANYTLTVKKIPITVKADDATLTYGDDFTMATVTVTGATESELTGMLQFTTKYAKGKSVGEYDVTPYGLTSDKYDITFESGTIKVSEKELNLSDFVIGTEGKTYDGTTDVVIEAHVNSDAVVGSDNLRAEISGSFTDSNAGEDKEVSFEITSISGRGFENYVLAGGTITGTTEADITSAEVTFFVSEETTRSYDGTAQKVDISAMALGRVFAESNYTVYYQADGEEKTTEPVNVNEYTVTVELTETSGNYVVVQPTAKLIISVDGGANLYITGSNKNVTVDDEFTLHAYYGNQTPAVTWASDNEDIATVDQATGAVTVLKSGTAKITATISDANYAGESAEFELTAAKKRINIKVPASELVKTYTGTEQKINFTASDIDLAEKNVTVNANYVLISDSGVVAPVQAGTYTVSYEVDDDRYIADGNTTLTINKATVVVKAKDISKVYGDEPAYELEIVSGSEIATLDEMAALAQYVSDGAAKTAGVGTYDITLTLAADSDDNRNYVVSDTKGVMTVTKAPLTVTVKDVSREFGSENPTLEAIYTGFKNEETENTENIFTGELVLTYDASITTDLAVGTYEAKTTATGIEAANYTITFVPGDVTITKIGVTASAGTARSSYLTIKLDKAIPGLTAANFEVKNGEEVITLTDVIASSDNKTYTLKGSFGASVTYTVTTTFENETHKIISEPLSMTPSSSGGGSSGGGGGVSTCTVSFETNDGSKVDSIKVTRNKTLAEPTAPTKDGYTFDGWYTDKELTTAYDFETKVTKSFTLYAKWTKVKTEEPDDNKPGTSDTECDGTIADDCPSLDFEDLDVKAWYHLDTDYVIENGIFKGTIETTFAPNDKLTRAMLVTVLYRAEGEPGANRSIPFADVDMGAYYANAVSWAKQNGIVKGVSENEFAPNSNITREQIAAIMHRYASYKGYDVSVGENTNILSYDDYDSISEYAIASVQYAVGSGILRGKTESTLNPQDNATRAEIAAILHRFIEANK